MKADRLPAPNAWPLKGPVRETPSGLSRAPVMPNAAGPAWEGALGNRWALALLAVATVAHFSALPLAHTDLWGHLAYGRVIAQQGLPAFEPLQRPGAGIPFVDTAWLTQWAAFHLANRLGWAALQWAHALVMTAGALLLGAIALQLSAWRPALWLAPAGWLLLAWSPWQVIRPQLLGVLLFLVLLWLLTQPGRRRSRPLLLTALFALWANLHGSFPVGWVALLVMGLERVLRSREAVPGMAGTLANTHPSAIALADRAPVAAGLTPVLSFASDLFAAVGGTLVNPWGVGLWPAVLSVARHPNVADLTEWQPLRWDRPQGAWLALALALFVALAIWRWLRPQGRDRVAICDPARDVSDPEAAPGAAPRELPSAALRPSGLGPVPLWPLVLTLLFVVATCLSARYLVWTAATLPLGLILLTRFQSFPSPASTWPELRPAVWCVGLAVLALSPPLTRLWSQKPRAGTGEVVADTPVAEAAALHEFADVCRGPVLAPVTWGDYLLWAAPPQLAPFTASHV
ncbi:MAG: hypothetical protein ACKOFW_13865, partial [Planctomycetaceae bacterium]